MKIQPLINEFKEKQFQYAFYFKSKDQPPVLAANADRFPAASIIKVPLLLAWAHLERRGELHRSEICDLDGEIQVKGAGFSWLLAQRKLPYQDVLLMMISLSDNLCTNLVIARIGLERAARVIREDLGLPNTQLQRKLMDYEARSRGLDNWINPRDCVRFFELFEALTPQEKAWIEPMLLSNQDDILLKRNIPRDTLDFYHKTGSITGVLHDWGYTRDCSIFLLTSGIKDEPAAFEMFGKAGQLLIQ